jgi:hypothetical protein
MLVAVLFFARYFLRTMNAYQPGAALSGGSGSLGLITDGLVVFGVGLVAMQRLELWLRCRRLMADASAAS